MQYGQILEGTREALDLARPPGIFVRALRTFFFKQIFPRPEILSALTRAVRFQQRSGLRAFAKKIGVFKLLPKRLRELEEMQPDIPETAFLENAPDIFTADGGEPAVRVAFFAGCVMDQFMGGIHRATVKVLQAHGVEVHAVKGQVCCGALMVHAGDGETARTLARKNLRMFHGLNVSAIVNNSAGCGAQLKDYHHLLHNDPEAKAFAALTKDVSEVLAPLQPRRALKPLNKTVCYDPPCHLMHAQKITAQPVAILQRIPGIKWVTLPDAEFCCGAAGIYNLTQPEMSQLVLARPKSKPSPAQKRRSSSPAIQAV